MRSARAAFTLIEMMISIVILSIMMLFLYQTYASLNKSNAIYAKKASSVEEGELKKRVIYMDFSLALSGSVRILKQDKNEDVVFMQSSNSLHKRHNPYIAYILKNEILYRLESLQNFKEYPLSVDIEFVVDSFEKVDSFRVYKSEKVQKDSSTDVYLVHINFQKDDDILMKIKTLNEY